MPRHHAGRPPVREACCRCSSTVGNASSLDHAAGRRTRDAVAPRGVRSPPSSARRTRLVFPAGTEATPSTMASPRADAIARYIVTVATEHLAVLDTCATSRSRLPLHCCRSAPTSWSTSPRRGSLYPKSSGHREAANHESRAAAPRRSPPHPRPRHPVHTDAPMPSDRVLSRRGDGLTCFDLGAPDPRPAWPARSSARPPTVRLAPLFYAAGRARMRPGTDSPGSRRRGRANRRAEITPKRFASPAGAIGC